MFHPESDSAPTYTKVGPRDVSAGTQLLEYDGYIKSGYPPSSDRVQARGTMVFAIQRPSRPVAALTCPRSRRGTVRDPEGVPPASGLLALRSAGVRAGAGVRGARGGPPASRPAGNVCRSKRVASGRSPGWPGSLLDAFQVNFQKHARPSHSLGTGSLTYLVGELSPSDWSREKLRSAAGSFCPGRRRPRDCSRRSRPRLRSAG